MAGNSLRCQRGQALEDRSMGRISKSAEHVIGMAGFTHKTITVWLWFCQERRNTISNCSLALSASGLLRMSLN
jgi:hypothetical protein